jgi:predicted flap endonuclease-1-like 5' DNA nuclease
MGLLSKLKSMLGLEESERAPGSGVDVTVEREPGDDTAEDDGDESPGEEPAAAGSDAAASTESLVDDEGTDDPDRAAEPAEAAGPDGDEDAEYVATDADVGTDADAESDAEAAPESESDTEPDAEPEPDDLTDIKGVGPAYADRLNDAGVTTFAALADADPDDLGAETDLSPKRVGRWIDRANDR